MAYQSLFFLSENKSKKKKKFKKHFFLKIQSYNVNTPII